MATNHPSEKTSAVSMEQIISAIRESRDRQIEELLKEPLLMTFLEHYFNTVAISDVKKAFLNKDLIELKNSPLDLSFYSSLITQMKESNNETVDGSHKLFLVELKKLFQKYGFQ